MDCLEAQAAISAALDRSPVDSSTLDAAKAHCRSCSDCNEFVRILAAVQRHSAPEAQAGLPDKIMERVRTEASLSEAQRGARDRATHPSSAEVTSPNPNPKGRFDLRAIIADPSRRAAAMAWTSAAAVVLIASGFLAITGVRQILLPPAASEVADSAMILESAPRVATQAPTGGGAIGSSSGTQTVPAVTGYIVTNGTVFKYAGVVQGIDVSTMSGVASARSALDSNRQPESVSVYGTADPSRVYVSRDSSKTVLAFDRVTRLYQERVYALQSREIERFGEWPTLPSGITAPISPTGSPSFTTGGVAAGGITIYYKVGGDAKDGIAVAPGTGASDPAGGNPNWTWWIPLD